MRSVIKTFVVATLLLVAMVVIPFKAQAHNETIAVIGPNGQIRQATVPSNTIVTNATGMPEFLVTNSSRISLLSNSFIYPGNTLNSLWNLSAYYHPWYYGWDYWRVLSLPLVVQLVLPLLLLV